MTQSWGTEPVGERTRAVQADAPAKLVYEREREDVIVRRGTDKHVPTDAEVRTTLAGIALAGGGIRSATFSLGVLQKLGEAKKLFRFDFLSTVSGGGFLGGWYSAWLARTWASGQIPPSERIEQDRHRPLVLDGTVATPEDVPDGSKSAQNEDPIHHLRLFSNYLTPRRGVFSGDTWRAAVVITRNLVLTWLVCLPLLLAAVTAAQLYFVADYDQCESERSAIGMHDPQAKFVCPSPSTTPTIIVSEHRLLRAVTPGLVILGWLCAFTLVWIVFSTGAWWLPSTIGIIANGLIALVVFYRHSQGGANPLFHPIGHLPVFLAFWGSVVIVLVYGLASWLFYRVRVAHPKDVPWETLRTRIVRHQAVLLSFAVALTVVLMLTALGADTVAWLTSPSGGPALAITKAGGWFAILLSLLSAVYTSIKSAPSARGAKTDAPQSSGSQLIFTLAPPLLLIVLLLGAASIVRQLFVASRGLATSRLSYGMLAGIGVMVLFAGFEFVFEPEQTPKPLKKIPTSLPTLIKRVAALLIACVTAYIVGQVLPVTIHSRFLILAGAFMALALLVLRLVTTKKPFPGPLGVPGLVGVAAALLIGAVGFAYLCTHGLLVPAGVKDIPDAQIRAAVAAIIVFVPLYLIGEWVTVETDATRSTVLVAIGMTAAAAWLIVSTLDGQHYVQVHYVEKAVSAITIFISAVIALGWMIDPNLMSLHNFYKSRLVRAYLGASNRTGRTHQEITDSAPGDDVLLCELKNAEKGAPIHLINTTLNLVGARDLATAQRSAASFVLSHKYCGSMRTGFRPTERYMSGKLTLGAAVAASGAAVSPNMGARTQSAAISLLLALFNVRLGLWAPTPDKRRWIESQPHLWPFYLLREALSQTNDLGTFSYLTDGGHFDNTGLYSLVERGVRFIVIVDSGEDPRPCFADLGDAIRRCRIDFGAEIDLTSGAQTFQDPKSNRHWVVGKIRYADPHLAVLGWTPDERRLFRDGTILWLKPRVASLDSVDVQQYHLEHDTFPHQTTVNQWFDEAQFESYRALGYQSAASLL